MDKRMDIKSMTLPELEAEMERMDEKKYRAAQIFTWLHKNYVNSFEEMTNLSKQLRDRLSEQYTIFGVTKELVQISKMDGTRKYLFKLSCGNLIESVLMRYEYGNTVCVSSQAGCRMGCKFCASTIDGLARSLQASEILSQVYEIEKDIQEPVSHVVIMGSGEPFDNYDNVVRFIRLISDEKGKHLSRRNITVSTCGIVENIRKFAKEDLPVTLALSLHAADDETRKKLMPIANKYSIAEILSACEYYFEQTGRRVSYEYSLVHNVNDRKEEAEKLGKLLAHKNAHINLIPVNEIEERDFKKPDLSSVYAFQKMLAKYGISVTIRREMGSDIDGACGQLRRRHL